MVPVVGMSMAWDEAEMAKSSKVATNIMADSIYFPYYLSQMQNVRLSDAITLFTHLNFVSFGALSLQGQTT